jgi:uncharacterized protein (DUF433 family)
MRWTWSLPGGTDLRIMRNGQSETVDASPRPQAEVIMEGVSAQHITKTPEVCGGRACIAGHRIRVMDIVVLHEMRGYCAAEISAIYPGITLADIHASLAYYFDNVEEIQNEFRHDEEAAKELLIRHPSKVREKLGG